MKIHRILAEAAADILREVFRNAKVLDHTLADAFSNNPRWGKRDRAFIAETVFEVTRWRRALEFIAVSPEVNALCAAQWMRMELDLPDWWKHAGASPAEMRDRETALATQPRAIRESIPDWLDQVGESELGDAWENEIHALNQRAPVFLRVNTLLATREEVIAWLHENHVETAIVDGLPEALVLPPGKMLPKPLRNDGRIEIQDAGSQMIAPLLDLRPGQRVIDACAGAGGKALHLAALMQNDGRLYAMDVDEKKLHELKFRARRARVTCIVPKPILETTPADFENIADRLLIDAPCSGLGTLRRQPDLKWRLKPAQLDRVRGIQRDILASYPAMVKPGGRLVYATCSILPSENRAAIQPLLDSGNWELADEAPVSPAATGFDGFYAAAITRKV
ncbi:MAG: RsmB/NOP family class I SAM-dependent RNA methyltransferase [Luteolibacter sp.]